jgi:hypothetical protein
MQIDKRLMIKLASLGSPPEDWELVYEDEIIQYARLLRSDGLIDFVYNRFGHTPREAIDHFNQLKSKGIISMEKKEQGCIFCDRTSSKNTLFISFLGRASGHEYVICEHCIFEVLKEFKLARKNLKIKKLKHPLKSKKGITKMSLENFLKSQQEESNEKFQ